MSSRKRITKKENAFPYDANGPASNTSGSLGGSNAGPDVSSPNADQVMVAYRNRGSIIPSGIGNTDYIDANTINHGVFAGNS